MTHFNIITIFPKVFKEYFNTSIIGRAKKAGLIDIKIHDLRDFTNDKRKTVDDRPFGGGPGMVLKVAPIYKALRFIEKDKQTHKVLLTPKGQEFNQKKAKNFSKKNNITLIAGRYEAFDARVNNFIDEQISIGPYVLTGGELPAMIIVDAVCRLVPEVIEKASLKEETYSSRLASGKKNTEYPQYTRPEVFKYKDKTDNLKKLKVPKILLSGNHKKIREWKQRKAH